MTAVIEIAGERFGNLLVLGRSVSLQKGQARWDCVCDCGKNVTVRSQDLRIGHTTSCGCAAIKARVKASLASRKCHSLSRTPIYAVWKTMLLRCHNPKNHAFRYYGARGISVCPAWWDFETFYREFGCTRPSRKFSMDRKDNNDGYWLGNMRWATAKEQANNRRDNRRKNAP
jgi:hypothetical protein